MKRFAPILIIAALAVVYITAGDVLTIPGNLVVTGNLTNTVLTPSRAVVTSSSTNLASSATTAAELDFVSGVTSAIQTQLNGKQASGSYLTAPVANGSLANSSITVTGTNNQVNVGGSPVSLGGTVTLGLPNTGTAGTYTSVTTDAQGRVSAGSNPAVTSAANWTASGTTNSTLTGNATVNALTATNGVTSTSTVTVNFSSSSGTPLLSFPSSAKVYMIGSTMEIGGAGILASLDPTFVLGSSGDLKLQRDNAAELQLGVDSATPVNQTFKAPDATGADHNGGKLTLEDGQPTGTGSPQRIWLKSTTTSTSSASTNQPYITPLSIGGTLKVDTTTTGNVGGGEDTLITYTIPAGQLAVNGDRIKFDVWGSTAANANTKDIKVYYGSTVIYDSTAIVLNGISWRCHGTIVRTGAATQTATAEFTISGTLLGAVTTTTATTSAPAETLSGTVVFKVTGTDSGVTPVDNSIVQNAMTLEQMFNGN